VVGLRKRPEYALHVRWISQKQVSSVSTLSVQSYTATAREQDRGGHVWIRCSAQGEFTAVRHGTGECFGEINR